MFSGKHQFSFFTYGLFNNSISSLCIVSCGRMIINNGSEEKWKDLITAHFELLTHPSAAIMEPMKPSAMTASLGVCLHFI